MIFLGCLFDRTRENEYLNNSRTGLSNAANTFQWNVIDGLHANGCKYNILNALPVGTFPHHYNKLILHSFEWFYEGNRNFELGCVNLPIIKQFQRYLNAKRTIKTLGEKNILIYSTYEPFLKAIYKLDDSYTVTLIVTDLPQYYDLGKTSFLKRYLRNRNNTRIYKYLNRVDKFVLLTEQMKDPLKLNDRPYTVIEGIANMERPMCSASTDKIILYTGALHEKFGIITLLEAFSLIEDESVKLWICGRGEAESSIIAASEKDARITYFGFVPKKKALELQQQAYMLINPRPNEGEYTKYSFPSKTMEYMLSGKPVVMYKLDGIPVEYDDHLIYIQENSPNGIKQAIHKVLTKTPQEVFSFGQQAAEFVANNKNSLIQAKKILDFIEE